MGYFSNGTEGSDYETKWCSSCVHNTPSPGCNVMLAHLLFNGTPGSSDVLDILIPRSKDQLSNLKCTMHVSSDTVKRERKNKLQLKLYGDLTLTGTPEN